jgi:hypothetical protein
MGGNRLTVRELNRATLARQLLLRRAPVGPVEAVARLAGMQAQEPRPPFVGLWSRLDGFRREDLHAALHAGEVVRGTLMRGTLHLATADDFRAWRTTTRVDVDGLLRFLGDRAEGLDVDAVLAAARELLGAEPRTFGELRALLRERFPDVDERGLGYATRMLLPLTMVPTDDRWGFPRDARFALADEPDDGDARAALVLRHLAAYGPASVADIQAWSGLKRLKPVVEALRDRLVTFRDERGRELFDLPDAPRPGPDVPAPPRLLPEFDSLVLAHDDRSRIIRPEHRGEIATRNLRIRAVFLVDGIAGGTWTTERRRRRAVLRLQPFEPLPRDAVDGLVAEAEALLRFLEPDADEHAVEVAAG